MHNILEPHNNTVIQSVNNAYIEDLKNRERARMGLYIAAREYYDGIHNTQLTDRARKYLNLDNDADFTVNYCPMIVNAKADRLSVSGFDTNDDQQATLWRWWRHNRMDRKQGIVHRATIRDGDSFVLVEWDAVADMPRFHYEPAYTGEGVMVYYSEERRDEIEFASKRWQIKYGPNVGKQTRLNLYYPDRIEKYIAHDEIGLGSWQPFEDETTETLPGRLGMAGVNWWTDNGTETGVPLGIPIVHFKNDDSGDQFGTSHLAKVMPVQDAVNKSMIDLLAAMDANGFPVLVGTGTDAWMNIKVGPGAIAAVSKPASEADLKVLPAMSPTGLLSVYNALVMELARISGTPLSYFQSSGQVAAEGTMKQQEIALISQVEKSQTDFGNSWEDCLNIARRLHNAFSTATALDTAEIIDTVWDEAESRNDKAQAETLAIKVAGLGVSEDQAQIEMGYDANQRAGFARAQLRGQALSFRQAANQQPETGDNENLTQTENEESNGQARASPTS